MTGLNIDFSQEFEHLSHAPIVEAVISIHAKPEQQLDEKELTQTLKSKLPDYPHVASRNQSAVKLEFSGQGQAPSAAQNIIWQGVQFQSGDQKSLAQFNKDGFLFSKLSPYTEWSQLRNEAFRLFDFFVEIARPREVQRLGLRFVNRFELPTGETQLDKYIRPCPQAPIGLELPLTGFFHQDSFMVPGHVYGINVVRTVQPPPLPGIPGISLIIDTDVFTTVPYELDLEKTKRHFNEMRWLKNKVFFGSITEDSVNLFK